MTLPAPSDLSDAELDAALSGELALLGVDWDAVAESSATGLEELAAITRSHPIASASLWVNEAAPWDQRRLVAALMAPLTLALGGNRCLSGDTLVELADGTQRRIDEIRGWVQVLTPEGPMWAEPHRRKGPDPLYRVEISTGDSFTATAAHRVLDARGAWLPIARLRPGSALARPPSSSEFAPSVHGEDGPRSSRTTPGSPDGCRPSLRCDGGRPRPARGSGQDAPPSPAGALLRARRTCDPKVYEGGGDSRPTPSRSRHCPDDARPSSLGARLHHAGRGADTGSCASRIACPPSAARIQGDDPPPHASHPPPRSTGAGLPTATHKQGASDSPVVTSITYVRTDYHYDLWVPGPQCFVAAGAVHHNSGKTYAILEASVAFALGGDHPAVRAWLTDNDLPRDLIPDGPGHVCLIAQTGPTSISLHRKVLCEDLLPRDGVRSWNLNTPQEARIEISVPGYSRPATIWFKSVDQGHRKFKGSEYRFAAVTEEPEGEEGKLVLDELMRGASSVGGRVVLDMTPQNGMTWVYDDLFHARRYGCQVIELDTTHNALLPDYASVQRWLASLTEEQRTVRQRGQFVDRKGQIYAEWTRGDGDRHGPGNLCTSFNIPPEWPRFRAADFGQTDPTAVLWGALGDDAVLYVYREHYKPNTTYQEHGEAVEALSEGESYRASVGDPSSGGRAAMELWRMLGLYFDLAVPDVDAGISTVRSWMAATNGSPRIKVFSSCTNTIREVEGYRWDPVTKRPIKRHDHTCDALRFLVAEIERWRML